MKKVLPILIFIFIFAGCNLIQKKPKTIQLENPRTQICLTDTSILLPSFTTITKGENIEFTTQLQFKKDGVYLLSPNKLLSTKISLEYADSIRKSNDGFHMSNNTDNVGLEYISKDDQSNFIYFAPYSKFMKGRSDQIKVCTIKYYANDKYNTADYKKDEAYFNKKEFDQYMGSLKTNLQ